jgi:hypothetical protein
MFCTVNLPCRELGRPLYYRIKASFTAVTRVIKLMTHCATRKIRPEQQGHCNCLLQCCSGRQLFFGSIPLVTKPKRNQRSITFPDTSGCGLVRDTAFHQFPVNARAFQLGFAIFAKMGRMPVTCDTQWNDMGVLQIKSEAIVTRLGYICGSKHPKI